MVIIRTLIVLTMKPYLTVVFTYISLMTNEVEQVLISQLTIPESFCV